MYFTRVFVRVLAEFEEISVFYQSFRRVLQRVFAEFSKSSVRV